MVMASFVDVTFKKDGVEVFKTQGSIGCVRQGQPQDSYTIIRSAMYAFNDAAAKGSVKDIDFSSVTVGNTGREFTRKALEKAGVISKRAP